VYQAVLRTTAVLALVLASVTSARANARVFVDVPAANAFNRSYYDSWTTAANNGTASAFPGNHGETKNGRIDYIFYSKGSNLSVKSSQVYDTRDANGVLPSDHRPVLTTFIVK
jgi:endonuclease/exonuclease/phosphatase family metal-dependent hydrolase